MKNDKENPETTGLEIAVIGMAGRFPGAKNITEFWHNLTNGVEAVSFFSPEELDKAGFSPEVTEEENFVKAGGIMDDIDCFDSEFFGYMYDEAEVLDPQIRLFYECAWNALENAGYVPGSFDGLIGIYAGASHNFNWEAYSIITGNKEKIDPFMAGHLTDKDFLCSLISYKLNLRGPAVFMNTACSTSLVAVHLACQAILNGECDMALAGGAKVSRVGAGGYMFREGTINSPDGHCRAFDASARGIIGGDGVAIVVLKRLEDAIADRDHIYAVVKGSAINNDGIRKVGFTAPSIEGQVEVIKMARQVAEVEPESIGYIEAHGTGTQLGDPVEIEALKLAFDTDKRNYCGVGSVKSNIGHLDTAAGIAGFIKAVLVLAHRQIPPTLHFEKLNPRLGVEESPFYINAHLRDWENNGAVRRSGVSSFGIGGTNAHVILEEWPAGEREEKQEAAPPQIIPLSARTPAALERNTRNLAEYFKQNPDVNLADAAYTLQVGRTHFANRRMLTASSPAEAADYLFSVNPARVTTFLMEKEPTRLYFMFSGQGSQYVDMGRDLYEKEEVFRQEMGRCFEILKPIMGVDPEEILYPGAAESGDAELINQTHITQPLLFSFEFALAKLLIHWGLQPDVMIGHSIGEYVAACLSGVFSLEDALAIVTLRGKLMQEMPAGAMLSVSMPEEELKLLLDENPDLDLAAVNSSQRCVVSGSFEAVDAFAAKLQEKGTASRRLKTSHAFHSAMMDPALEKFAAGFKKIKAGEPGLPFISNVTGKNVTIEDAVNPAYWAKHIRSTVRFADGIAGLLKEESAIFVEVGPGTALTTFVRQHEDLTPQQFVTNLVRHPGEKMADDYFMLNRIGLLWLHGQKIDWMRCGRQGKGQRIPLPGYSFEPIKHTAGGNAFNLAKKLMAGTGPAPLKKADIKDWFYVSSWQEAALPTMQPDAELKKSAWLIFADRCGLATRFAETLVEKGHEVIMVEAGTQYAKKGDASFIIDPGRDDHYDVLFNGLSELHYIPQRIVHLWGVTGETGSEVDLDTIDRFLDLGLYSVLSIARAVGQQDIFEEIRIEVISDGVRNISGTEPVNPAKAAILGAVKVIPLEYTNIKCRSLDIASAAVGSSAEADLLHLLYNEIESESTDIEIAYRDNCRWLRVYEPYPIERMDTPVRGLKKRGVYLIIGGFGGMGFSIAEYLAKSYQARLFLIGRTALPERNEWQQWLDNHDEQDETSQKIRKVLGFEQEGAEIKTAAVDITDPARMLQVVTEAEKAFGQVNGVIHAAGVIDYGGVIRKRTREITGQYIVSKVHGTLILGQIFKDKKPDFMALFSSIGNVLYKGKFGQVSYNAANEFIEAYAEHNSLESGVYTFSVNWCDWRDVGMTVRSTKEYFETIGREDDYNAAIFNAVSPEEGVEAFIRLLSAGQVRYTVTTYDLATLIERQATGQNRQETGVQQYSVALRQRPGLSTDYVAPQGELEEKLVRVWETFFHIEKIGVLDDFYELGGDSLRLLSLINLIKEELKLTVSMDTMMLYPSIRGLVESIREQNLLSQLECIVKMNKGGNAKNIFMIHPLHGMVYQYKELSKLLEKDFNIYGVQSRGMLKNSKLPETLDELVDDYIQQIRTVQENGPYIIAGYCFGDMIGYKIVKLLENMQVPVEKFVMLDEIAFIPGHVLDYYRQQRIIDSMLKPVNIILDVFRKKKEEENRGVESDDLEEEPLENEEQDEDISPKKMKIRAKMNINRLNKKYWRGSAFNRTPGIIKAPILAIKARNTHFTVFEEDLAKMTLGKLIFIEIPGDHGSIFRYPHVEQLAEVIRKNV